MHASPIEGTMDYMTIQREQRELRRKLKKRNDAIRRLREQGWTLQRIADRYGVTRQRVGKIVEPR
jgi:hypothetical protein